MATAVIGVVLLLLTVVTLFSSVQIVEEGQLEALLVFGEMQAVLEPGLDFVPPFVSTTYPIDPQTMTMDAGEETIQVPAEFEQDVREGANR